MKETRLDRKLNPAGKTTIEQQPLWVMIDRLEATVACLKRALQSDDELSKLVNDGYAISDELSPVRA